MEEFMDGRGRDNNRKKKNKKEEPVIMHHHTITAAGGQNLEIWSRTSFNAFAFCSRD